MNFPQRLRELRKGKNLTQNDMAKLLNITVQAYGAYERGRSQPDFDTLVKIADFFNVSIDYLLGRTNIPYSANQFAEEKFNDPDLLEVFIRAHEDKDFEFLLKKIVVLSDRNTKLISKIVEVICDEETNSVEKQEKTERLTFWETADGQRLSEKEYYKYAKRANRLGISITEYLRQMGFIKRKYNSTIVTF